MNLYIWQDVFPVSDCYHDLGGVVIIADSLESAREVWTDWVDGKIKLFEDDYIYSFGPPGPDQNRQSHPFESKDLCVAVADPPAFTAPLSEEYDGGNQLFIFPNAGCC